MIVESLLSVRYTEAKGTGSTLVESTTVTFTCESCPIILSVKTIWALALRATRRAKQMTAILLFILLFFATKGMGARVLSLLWRIIYS